MLNGNEILFALEIACTGYFYACILIDVDGAFEFIGDWLTKLKRAGKIGAYLSKPLGMCEKCFTGQLSCWVWLALHYKDYGDGVFNALLRHVIFISLSVVFITLLKLIINKWKHSN